MASQVQNLRTFPTTTLSSSAVHFAWPRTGLEEEGVVLQQLHSSISISDRSGIIARFEDAFSDYHGGGYALSSCNGTSALYGIFFSLWLRPGDEVIVPNYTFFASASPLLHTGARIVLADCDLSGNISPKETD